MTPLCGRTAAAATATAAAVQTPVTCQSTLFPASVPLHVSLGALRGRASLSSTRCAHQPAELGVAAVAAPGAVVPAARVARRPPAARLLRPVARVRVRLGPRAAAPPLSVLRAREASAAGLGLPPSLPPSAAAGVRQLRALHRRHGAAVVRGAGASGLPARPRQHLPRVQRLRARGAHGRRLGGRHHVPQLRLLPVVESGRQHALARHELHLPQDAAALQRGQTAVHDGGGAHAHERRRGARLQCHDAGALARGGSVGLRRVPRAHWRAVRRGVGALWSCSAPGRAHSLCPTGEADLRHPAPTAARRGRARQGHVRGAAGSARHEAPRLGAVRRRARPEDPRDRGSTMGLYVLLHGAVSVTDAFTLVALVNICRAVVNEFTTALTALSQARSSFRRIDKFLASHEFKAPATRGQSLGDVGRISLRNAHAEWPISTRGTDDDDDASSSAALPEVLTPGSGTSFALKDLSLDIKPGSLVMVVGAVGSGKSSLLSALLGEMTLREGELEVHGDISYVSQEPWIRNCSVKSNIVFESAFDAAKYESVLRASQLSLDLHALPNGDQTEIGERGINLSGGQKARVAIARAFYRSEYDILVLDDPLSAVDAHVAHAIFDEGIVALAANKTRILVLNSHYDLLARADKVVVFQDGQIVGDGTYDEVLANFPELRYENQHHDEEPKRGPEPTEGDSATTMDTTLAQEVTVKGEASPNAERLVRDEDRATGTVGGRVYRAYFNETGHNGVLVLLVLVVAYSVSQTMRVLVDWWQGFWASNMTRRGVDPTYSGTVFGMWYLGFIVVCSAVTLGRGLIMTEACVRSAKNLHDELFKRVLSAPINLYFDVTPIGRILNRFSNDLDQMDSVLPQQYQMLFQNVAMSVGSLVVSAVSSYWICVAYLPLLVVFVFTGRHFNKTSREVKRLEGVSRSPVYNLFGETLAGLQTIRAFKMQQTFADLSEKVVDENTAAYFSYCAVGRWLAVRLDWLSVVVILVVSLYLVAAKGQISPVVAGISLTYSLMLTSTMQNTVRAVDSTDNAMTSVERLLHFRSIPVEEDSPACVPVDESAWPSHGAIKFDNLCLKYRPDLPLVLRGVSMSVAAGEKVGICGRTGAGKSSLMVALFRICEFHSGSVTIDGVDIQQVRLADLRRSLAIIPQDPVLFSGSIRENLDPLKVYSDADMWAVLRQVHLAEAVTKWGAGLDFEVSEAGDNLSVGQRQLLCIGRALLKQSKIVVLDEATASVDSATDELIQTTIKQTFKEQTVLIMAHRINTILHCDKIAVMDAGRVAEFAPPSELLARPNSAFAALMKRAASTLVV